MSDAARLAKSAFLAKPRGVTLASYTIEALSARHIEGQVQTAILDASFSAAVSYIEALEGLKQGASSWPVVKLYYSCFYSIKSLLLVDRLVPFISGEQYVYDLHSRSFVKVGVSSHKWNWTQLRRINRIRTKWFISQDSEDAYLALQGFREDVNYKYSFAEPETYSFLVGDGSEAQKRIKIYRDDNDFLFTYLSGHVALAYPTKLLYHLDFTLSEAGLKIDSDKKKYLKDIWIFKERCPCAI